MAPTTLLGPPEIHRPKPTPSISDPFMDLMVSKFNSTKRNQNPPMGYTENHSPTFLSTGNPCLDFFFHVVPNTPAAALTERLRLAWDHDALTTLKLICNLRGVRGTGKSDKEGYYTSAMWLHKHHPKTLACNVGPLADFGYFKDLPEILYRLLEGPEVRQKAKDERLSRLGRICRGRGGFHERGMRGRGRGGFNFYGRRIITKTKSRDNKNKEKAPREADRIMAEKKRAELEKEKARENRESKKIGMAKKAVERYRSDPDYRFLYEQVSDLFSELLKADLKYLREGNLRNISLAAKWCPSIDSSFDKSTLLCEGIARKVFDKKSFPEYEDVEEAHYAYRVRDRLRKEVLVPLRKALELPEVYIGANDWGSIPYNRVASVAMNFYKEKFLKHDKSRFEEYLEKVKDGKATIAAGALMPHKIIASLDDGDDNGQVAELQWKRMVGDMAAKGKLKNCLAISDVSGSMSGIPMEVSVALGVLVSELSEEPWKGKLITFSENPELQMVVGDDLKSKVEFVRRMEWGMNTDFQKVFDLILQVAVNGNLSEEQMIKRVFVFSDMEFDQASKNARYYHYESNQGRIQYFGTRQLHTGFSPESNDNESDDEGYMYEGESSKLKGREWETDYEAIVRKFKEKGYGSSVPEIVFWNLRDSKATPVAGNKPGVALVSGYSKNLMKLFLEDNGKLNPEAVMEAAIAGEEYKKLVVLD